jgi:hypothetical protein
VPIPVTPLGMAVSQASAAMPPPGRIVYNPTPPVKPVAKKSLSCLSVVGGLIAFATLATLLGAALVR